jgi:enoyl-CoA hydratase/carnithine racemase
MVLDRALSNGVLVLTMNRPERRNALNRDLFREIGNAFVAAETDPEVRAIVLTGAGDQAFCAGMDLKAFAAGEPIGPGDGPGTTVFVERCYPKPIIAAVNGAAVAGGFGVMLGCDIIVAAEHATFGLPEVKRGLVPTCGGLFRTPRALPLNVAKEMLLTGDRLTPERAYALGLVNVVTEPGAAVASALELAARICAVGPVGARASLRALERTVAERDELGWEATVTATEAITASDDIREGMAAFFEKREPRWTGR